MSLGGVGGWRAGQKKRIISKMPLPPSMKAE
jgi:hypothetical protein